MEEDKRNLSISNFNHLEFEDTFVEIKDIRKGDVIYECDNNLYGVNYEFKAVYDAKEYKEGWMCYLEDNKGEIHEIFVSGSTKSEYLPNLYRVPQYIDEEDGEFFYPVK